MPAGLTKAAKLEWDRIVREALAVGLVTALDHAVFRQYIYEWQAVEELEKKCLEKGRDILTTVVDRSGIAYEGDWKRAPWDTSLVQHKQLLRGFLNEIGFTPAARSKVSTEKPHRRTIRSPCSKVARARVLSN